MSIPPPPQDLLAQYLAVTDERCARCGYHLRGCQSAVCPECGTGLRLALARAEHASAAWLTAVFGASASVLISILALLDPLRAVGRTMASPNLPALARMGMASPSDLPQWRSIALILVCVLISGACWSLLIAKRRRVESLTRPYRAAVAVAGLALPVVLTALLAFWIHRMM